MNRKTSDFLRHGLLAALGCLVVTAILTSSTLCGAQASSTDLPQAPSATLGKHPAQGDSPQASSSQQQGAVDEHGEPTKQVIGPDGKPIRPQQTRIFGVLPNYISVSGGTKPKPPGWRTDFGIANRQAYDYSSFGYLLLTSATAYAQDSHPSLDTVHGGNAVYYAYLWRGFVDKTDGTYQGSFFFPALLHEDTRYYALGTGSIVHRTLHAAGAVIIAHNYSGRYIPNVAGLAGKVGTQAVSTTYYPAGSEDFGVLAEKFTYSCLRQAGFTVLREFSPDLNALLHHKRRSASVPPPAPVASPSPGPVQP